MPNVRHMLAKLLTVAVAIQSVVAVALVHAPRAAAATPAAHVVISEVQTAGIAGADDEFIELYNPTGSDIDLTGWSIQKWVGGASQTIKDITAGRMIGDYGFYLIANDDYSLSLATPADETPFSGISSLSATSGTILLVRNTEAVTGVNDPDVADYVGYGLGADAEGANPASAPTSSGSIERKPGNTVPDAGNGLDTNDNGNDFATRSLSEPQNSSSGMEQPTIPTPPNVTMPGSVVTANDDTYTISGTAQTGMKVTAYQGANTVGTPQVVDVFGNFSITVPLTQNAVNSFSVTATNPDTMYESAATTVPAITEDSVAPVISNHTPKDNSYFNTSSVSISATVADPSGLDPESTILYVDGIQRDDYTDNMLSFLATDLTTDVHTLRVVATDAVGNVADQSWGFTIDKTKPVVSVVITKTAPVTNMLSTTIKIMASDTGSRVEMMRVSYDGTMDLEQWEPFQADLTRDLPDKDQAELIVVEVRDSAGNVSDFATARTVLDRTPVTSPTSATTTAVTGTTSITLNWQAVPGATSYVIRYSDGTVLYGPLTATGTSLTVTNLDPNKNYTFEIAAVNAAGTVSNFTKAGTVVSTVSTTTSESVASTADTPVSSGTSNLPRVRVTASPTPEATISASPSPEVRGGEDDANRDWTRVIVALSLLIIAAGVATGGWYLYQWWMTRPQDKKGKGKGGRW